MTFRILLLSRMINKYFILQIVPPSFGVLLLFLRGWFCQGGLFNPRALTALEIGTNEDIQVFMSGEATPYSMIVCV